MVAISFCPACGCCSEPKSRGPVTGVKGAATSSLGYQDMPSWPAARAQTKSNTNSPWEWSFSQAGAPAAGWPSASFSISASGCQPDAGPVQPASSALAKKRQSTNGPGVRSEEHTSELQSRGHLVCRLLLEKKKQITR